MFHGRVRRRLTIGLLVSCAVIIALMVLHGVALSRRTIGFGLIDAWWWRPLFLGAVWLLVALLLRSVHRVKKAVREAGGLACVDCLYDLGHQGVDAGRCPECGATYTLDELRTTWHAFLAVPGSQRDGRGLLSEFAYWLGRRFSEPVWRRTLIWGLMNVVVLIAIRQATVTVRFHADPPVARIDAWWWPLVVPITAVVLFVPFVLRVRTLTRRDGRPGG